MRIKYVITAVLCLTALYSQAQEDYEFIVVDSTLTGVYLTKAPEQIDQVLLLLPGFGQSPVTIFQESKLPQKAYENNTFLLALAAGPKLYADDTVINQINRLINHAVDKYQLHDKPLVIGGFSAGGTVALRYTELCHEKKNCPLLPEGVFTVDSPVDLFGIWKYFEDEIAKNYSEIGVNEAKFVQELMMKEYGAVPANTATYEKLTPYHWELKEPGNEKYLMDVAVRTYHDVDIPWQLENRRRSAFDGNYLYASDLINKLLLNGHKKAEFIQGKTGYRSNGTRHPHSWSIVDEEECIKWIKKTCSN